jgi:hypothetical protein
MFFFEYSLCKLAVTLPEIKQKQIFQVNKQKKYYVLITTCFFYLANVKCLFPWNNYGNYMAKLPSYSDAAAPVFTA